MNKKLTEQRKELYQELEYAITTANEAAFQAGVVVGIMKESDRTSNHGGENFPGGTIANSSPQKEFKFGDALVLKAGGKPFIVDAIIKTKKGTFYRGPNMDRGHNEKDLELDEQTN